MQYNPIVDEETGGFRIENGDGDVIYGPTRNYSLPVINDKEAMEALLSDMDMGQPQRDGWMLAFGLVDIEREKDSS